jgi:hypothetical protein
VPGCWFETTACSHVQSSIQSRCYFDLKSDKRNKIPESC